MIDDTRYGFNCHLVVHRRLRLVPSIMPQRTFRQKMNAFLAMRKQDLARLAIGHLDCHYALQQRYNKTTAKHTKLVQDLKLLVEAFDFAMTMEDVDKEAEFKAFVENIHVLLTDEIGSTSDLAITVHDDSSE